MKLPSIFALFFLILGGCTSKVDLGPVAQFNADMAYKDVLAQEKIGPRFVSSDAHAKLVSWIVERSTKNGIKPRIQKGEMNLEGKTVPIQNIIASINPSAKKRILFSAHYDTRPRADQDPDPKNRDKPILGVNDGASGVAVLLEMSRVLAAEKDFPIGVDFAYWDAEDLGIPSVKDSYCLGSQYFANHPDPSGYHAEFNINLDMVGRSGSVFPIERFSEDQASSVLEKLAMAAKAAKMEDYFPHYRIGPITDDHAYIGNLMKIPAVDLIYMTESGEFPPEWHTLKDTSEVISRDVLRGVGQTLLQLIWDTATSL